MSPQSVVANWLTLAVVGVHAGLRCQARYSQDGQWYNCKVDKETELGFQVTYTEYNNTEVVPLEYLRHMPKSTAEAAAVTADTFVVPEALVPLATDSEAEKTRKRKRIKMLKGKRRHIKYVLGAWLAVASARVDQARRCRLEAERDKKQASWQSFQAKTKKKKVRHGRAGLLSVAAYHLTASWHTANRLPHELEKEEHLCHQRQPRGTSRRYWQWQGHDRIQRQAENHSGEPRPVECWSDE